jgi:hypothetical protein
LVYHTPRGRIAAHDIPDPDGLRQVGLIRVTCMRIKTQVLIGLIALGLIDVVIPIPILALILIYVVLQRPTWFTDMVHDIYRT